MLADHMRRHGQRCEPMNLRDPGPIWITQVAGQLGGGCAIVAVISGEQLFRSAFDTAQFRSSRLKHRADASIDKTPLIQRQAVVGRIWSAEILPAPSVGRLAIGITAEAESGFAMLRLEAEESS
jgi:hypothetical protein